MKECDNSREETEQVTLNGDVQTQLVNQRHTNAYDVDIGRANGGMSHMMNTEIGEPGWLVVRQPLVDEVFAAELREQFIF